MYRLMVICLVSLNLGLAFALKKQAASGSVLPLGIFDCCQTEGSEEPYCCRNCCWLTNDCWGDPDCR